MSNVEELTWKVEQLEARLDAQSELMKSLLTTFIIRGTLQRAEIQPLIDTAKEMAANQGKKSALMALDAFGQDLPGYQRSRMGPHEDDHDH